MASRHDDEAIGAAWDERMASRRNLYHGVVEWLSRDEELVVERGWSKEDYLRHLRTVLRRTLVGHQEAWAKVQADRERRAGSAAPRAGRPSEARSPNASAVLRAWRRERKCQSYRLKIWPL